MCMHAFYIFQACGHSLFSSEPLIKCKEKDTPQCRPTAHPFRTRNLEILCLECQLRRSELINQAAGDLQLVTVPENRWRVTYSEKTEDKEWWKKWGSKHNSVGSIASVSSRRDSGFFTSSDVYNLLDRKSAGGGGGGGGGGGESPHQTSSVVASTVRCVGGPSSPNLTVTSATSTSYTSNINTKTPVDIDVDPSSVQRKIRPPPQIHTIRPKSPLPAPPLPPRRNSPNPGPQLTSTTAASTSASESASAPLSSSSLSHRHQ